MGAPHSPPEFDATFEEVVEQRRADRRCNERRGAGLKLDLLFAATLIAHVETAMRSQVVKPYSGQTRHARPGTKLNIRA